MNFLSSIPWNYYLILSLILALGASGYLLNSKIEEVGSLQAQNSLLQGQLDASEVDKANLNATLQLSSKTALEDELERNKLRSDVAVLNKQITSLKRLTKDTPKSNAGTSDVKFNNQSSDDIFISDELKRVLDSAYCKASPNLCPDPSQPSK